MYSKYGKRQQWISLRKKGQNRKKIVWDRERRLFIKKQQHNSPKGGKYEHAPLQSKWL